MITQADFAAIAALDLDRIKTKLCHMESGEGWSRARANAVEREYKRFLYLMKAFPTEQTVPSVEIDTFWHYHILDTIKYAADCDAAFGYFLHHDPSVGLAGADEAEERLSRAARMEALYEETFGPAIDESDAAGQIASVYCGTHRPSIAWYGMTTVVNVAAWSGVEVQEQTEAAWCGMATSEQQAAWCGMATSEKKAAWCGMATSEKKAAWCGMATSEKKAAWCGMATSEKKAAWCGMATSEKKAAWCGMATSEKKAAWCGMATSEKKAAWCGMATSEQAEDEAVLA